MLIRRIQANFGTILFFLMAIAGTIRVMLERPVSGHYRIFTGAARVLLERMDPYEYDFKSVGYWFYSPSCGLFFFSLFSWLPDLVGLFLYTALSIFAIHSSLRFFLNHLAHDHHAQEELKRRIQWALAFLSIPLYQAVIAAKVETIMVAAVLFCMVRWQRKQYGWASFILGLILDWKFQIVPIAGLVGIILFLERKTLRPLIYLGLSTVFWHFLPAIYLGWDRLQDLFQHQSASLGEFIRKAYADFDNLFRFLKELGWNLSLQDSLVVSGMAALFFSFLVWFGYQRNQGKRSHRVYLMAIALGSIFCIGFSPLNQNNASILGTPVFIFAALWMANRHHPRMKWVSLTFILLFHFSYSDLMPANLKTVLRLYSIKSVLILVYGMMLQKKVLENHRT
jgi:hypothetical protein